MKKAKNVKRNLLIALVVMLTLVITVASILFAIERQDYANFSPNNSTSCTTVKN